MTSEQEKPSKWCLRDKKKIFRNPLMKPKTTCRRYAQESLPIIMGWLRNLRFCSHILAKVWNLQMEKKNVGLSELREILHTRHQVKYNHTKVFFLFFFDPEKSPSKKKNGGTFYKFKNSYLGFRSVASRNYLWKNVGYRSRRFLEAVLWRARKRDVFLLLTHFSMKYC